jgi:hypothetical protein
MEKNKMNSNNSKIIRATARGFLGTVLVALLAAGAGFAAETHYPAKHRQDLEHRTERAVKVTAKATRRAVVKSGKATGHYFARVGRAVF